MQETNLQWLRYVWRRPQISLIRKTDSGLRTTRRTYQEGSQWTQEKAEGTVSLYEWSADYYWKSYQGQRGKMQGNWVICWKHTSQTKLAVEKQITNFIAIKGCYGWWNRISWRIPLKTKQVNLIKVNIFIENYVLNLNHS